MPFSSFRGINAADLIKIHNTVSTDRICGEVLHQFEKVREQRNAIMHGVNALAEGRPGVIIKSKLLAYEGILKGQKWFIERNNYLFRTPEVALWSDDFIMNGLLIDWKHTVQILPRAELIRFFKNDPDQPSYICHHCRNMTVDLEDDIPTAQLKPENEKHTKIVCAVCALLFVPCCLCLADCALLFVP